MKRKRPAIQLIRSRAGQGAALAIGMALLLTALLMPGSRVAVAAECTSPGPVTVPGAEFQRVCRVSDLTTDTLLLHGLTELDDYSGLHAPGTKNPEGTFPGVQIDGYFPDTSTTNPNNGWFHDAQFVIRLPAQWNGKLVITGAPGNRGQYANDYIISDYVVARGYAFASTDKGNTGTSFYNDGVAPGDAIAEWHERVTELTRATKEVVTRYYGRAPAYTYITGISNGGYLTRWQLENHPELYDGGVDWEGTFFSAEGPNLHTFLPAALKHYPDYLATGSKEAHDAMIEAGFEPGSEFLWEYHYAVYWDLTQRIYREEVDPSYDGDLKAGIAFCQSGTPYCDADYDYQSRIEVVRDAVKKISLTGKIGKPMITLHGNLDALLPISTNAEPYAELVKQSDRWGLYRYYVVEDGNHVDGLYREYPERLRPILPCQRAAFEALVTWVEGSGARKPPSNRTLARPSSGDIVNECSLDG